MIVPGLVHDHCSAFHPIVAASPFLTGLNLASRGLTWLQPAVHCVHPLDDGSAGLLYRSIDRTVDGLGTRRSAMAPSVRADRLALRRLVRRRLPADPPGTAHPFPMARFGTAAHAPGNHPGSALEDGSRPRPCGPAWPRHAFHRLDRPLTSAVGLMLLAAAHARGWVVAEGGSQAIADALAATSNAHGGAHRDRPACDVGSPICRRATC